MALTFGSKHKKNKTEEVKYAVDKKDINTILDRVNKVDYLEKNIKNVHNELNKYKQENAKLRDNLSSVILKYEKIRNYLKGEFNI